MYLNDLLTGLEESPCETPKSPTRLLAPESLTPLIFPPAIPPVHHRPVLMGGKGHGESKEK